MKKVICAMCVCALLLLSACGVGGVHTEIKKPQEINVLGADGELIKTLGSKSELDEFYTILDEENWGDPVRFPENAVKRGELVLRQMETLKFGQSPEDLQMEELVRICVYDLPYVALEFELGGVRLCFTASDAAMEYFDTLFE